MDDNMRYPKNKFEAKIELEILLKVVKETREIYKAKELIKTLIGDNTALIKSHKTNKLSVFGSGFQKESSFWMALIRQALVSNFLVKEIENYGLIRLSSKGKSFLKNPESFLMTEDP